MLTYHRPEVEKEEKVKEEDECPRRDRRHSYNTDRDRDA